MTTQNANNAAVLLAVTDIIVKDRYRETFDQSGLDELSTAIREAGLIHPITVSSDNRLLAGERRYRVMCKLHEDGVPFKFLGDVVPPGFIPVLKYESEITELNALLIELTENKARRDFTALEEARMVRVIQQLRESERGKFDPATNPTGVTQKEVAIEAYGDQLSVSAAQKRVRDALRIEQFRDVPEVQKAASFKEAARLAEKLEKRALREAFSSDETAYTSARRHNCLLGDYRDYRDTLPKFPVIISDPPYGINANEVFDARRESLQRSFDDSYETWQKLMAEFGQDLLRLTDDNAYVMLFCTSERYAELASYIPRPFIVRPRPVIWFKGHMGAGSSGEYTFPRNNYDCILLARRGNSVLRESMLDVLVNFPANQQIKREQHPDAKPVELLKYLVRLTCFPGYKILDPFAGSGQIIEAASGLGVDVTAIEREKHYFGFLEANALRVEQGNVASDLL